MDFIRTVEQSQLSDVLRDFLAVKSTESDVRRVMATDLGLDLDLWRALADQVGVQAIAVPEEFGGAGMGVAETAVVLEELGSALSCVPFFSTCVLATNALLLADGPSAGPARSTWLPRIADGSVTATVALPEGRGSWDLESVTASAVETDQGWRVDGMKTFVLDGHTTDLVLMAARTPTGLGLFAMAGDAPGLRREVQSTMDQTRRFATLRLTDVPASLVQDDATAVLARLRDLALVALAAEQVGGAQRCLDMAVDYAKTRFQFGRPIGSFQAIKHKCADLLILIESARAAASYATWSAESAVHELPLAASMAKAVCSEAFFRAAGENIQIHGGIGFTWEHPAHLYFKRAKSSELWLGGPVQHRRRIAGLLDLTA